MGATVAVVDGQREVVGAGGDTGRVERWGRAGGVVQVGRAGPRPGVDGTVVHIRITRPGAVQVDGGVLVDGVGTARVGDGAVVDAGDRDANLPGCGVAAGVADGVVEQDEGDLPGGQVMVRVFGVVGDVAGGERRRSCGRLRDGDDGEAAAVGVIVVGEHVDRAGRAVLVGGGGVVVGGRDLVDVVDGDGGLVGVGAALSIVDGEGEVVGVGGDAGGVEGRGGAGGVVEVGGTGARPEIGQGVGGVGVARPGPVQDNGGVLVDGVGAAGVGSGGVVGAGDRDGDLADGRVTVGVTHRVVEGGGRGLAVRQGVVGAGWVVGDVVGGERCAAGGWLGDAGDGQTGAVGVGVVGEHVDRPSRGVLIGGGGVVGGRWCLVDVVDGDGGLVGVAATVAVVDGQGQVVAARGHAGRVERGGRTAGVVDVDSTWACPEIGEGVGGIGVGGGGAVQGDRGVLVDGVGAARVGRRGVVDPRDGDGHGAGVGITVGVLRGVVEGGGGALALGEGVVRAFWVVGDVGGGERRGAGSGLGGARDGQTGAVRVVVVGQDVDRNGAVLVGAGVVVDGGRHCVDVVDADGGLVGVAAAVAVVDGQGQVVASGGGAGGVEGGGRAGRVVQMGGTRA